MARILLLMFLILNPFTGGNMNIFKNKIKKTTSDKEKYVVLHTHGNVRKAETDFVAEVVAGNPVEAIKSVLPEFCKNWKLHPSESDDYAVIENPVSFVSDVIDNYSAQRGHLLLNKKAELCFLVESWSQEGPFSDQNIHDSRKVWATEAQAVLSKQLQGDHRQWFILPGGKYTAAAEDRTHSPYEFIRVSVIYELQGEEKSED